MQDYLFFLLSERGSLAACKFEGIFQELFRYGGIELHDIQLEEAPSGLMVDLLVPVQNLLRGLPLVEAGECSEFGVVFLKDLFADHPNLGFGGIDQPAFWVVLEIWLVVFDSHEGGCLAVRFNSVCKLQFIGDAFGLPVDFIRYLRFNNFVVFCDIL